MIKSFSEKRTELFFNGEDIKEYRSFSTQLDRKLEMLDSAMVLSDLGRLPGNRLESLKGNRKEQYSIRINRQWRLCFQWNDGNAYKVEVTDYHD